MRVLNLYSGLGGNRKLWTDVEVVAVENNDEIATVYKRLYPEDKVELGDAHDYLLKNYKSFDFIWSSPPCQTHSRMNKATRHNTVRYFDASLWQEIISIWYVPPLRHKRNTQESKKPLRHARKRAGRKECLSGGRAGFGRGGSPRAGWDTP